MTPRPCSGSLYTFRYSLHLHLILSNSTSSSYFIILCPVLYHIVLHSIILQSIILPHLIHLILFDSVPPSLPSYYPSLLSSLLSFPLSFYSISLTSSFLSPYLFSSLLSISLLRTSPLYHITSHLTTQSHPILCTPHHSIASSLHTSPLITPHPILCVGGS